MNRSRIPQVILLFIAWLVVLLIDTASLSAQAPRRSRDPQVEGLIQALKHEDWAIRGRAAWASGVNKSPELVNPLIAVLGGDPDERVRQSAAWALGVAGDPRAVDPLAQALSDPDWTVRRNAVEALERLNDSRAVPPLLHIALNEPHEVIRGKASSALARIDGSLTAEKIKEVLPTLNLDQRRNVVSILSWIKTDLSFELLWGLAASDGEAEIRGQALSVLREAGDPRGVGAFVAALKDPSDEVRRLAAGALKGFRTPEALQGLLGALKDPDWGVRSLAASALGGLPDAEALDALASALDDSESIVRRSALDALSTSQRPDIEKVLFRMALLDEDGEIRERAVSILQGRASMPLEGRLKEALRGEEPIVRLRAVEFLEKLDPAGVFPLLLHSALTDPDPGVRERAAWAVGSLKGVSPAPLLAERLRDGDESTRLHVVQVLGVIKGSESVGLLLSALRDPSAEIRAAVAGVLGQLRDLQAVPPLMEALGDRDPRVRSAAVGALASITGEALGEEQAEWVKWWEGRKGGSGGAGKD